MSNWAGMREIVRGNRARAERGKKDDYYNVDIQWASGYLWNEPKWENKIRTFFKEIHAAGGEVAYVDICGRATAEGMGADINYCFSLTVPWTAGVRNKNSNFPVAGDIFNPVDFNNFLQKIKAGGTPPAFATFRPIVGLQGYNLSPKKELKDLADNVAHARLEKNLRALVEVMRPGGYIYLEVPFQMSHDTVAWMVDAFRREGERMPYNKLPSAVYLKKLARQMKCTIEIDRSIGGNHYLLRTRLPK